MTEHSKLLIAHDHMQNSIAVIAEHCGDMLWLRWPVMTKNIRYSLHMIVSNGEIFMLTGKFKKTPIIGLLCGNWLRAPGSHQQ